MSFLGRQSMFPTALKGASKLTKISYIHAERYPTAEMKHGPIALISEQCLCAFLATQKDIFLKYISNIQERKARNAKVRVVTSEEQSISHKYIDDLIVIPNPHNTLNPILAAISWQLFAYYLAKFRGCDRAKPRNLAKSVTVEQS
jgi:glucosamine--fructose-6-phosphate aminotransferase (isomerizing)